MEPVFLPPAGFVLVHPITARTAIVAREASAPDAPRFFAKRVASAHRGVAEARQMLVREGCILHLLAGSGYTAAPVAEGADAAGPFLVTEMVAGRPVGNLAMGAVDEPTRELVAALQALDAVHGAADHHGPLQVVHGDLSPENLLVRAADGPLPCHVTVVDFELASYRDGGPPQDGSFRGTLRFAAPESAREGARTVRGDLFALGAIFYERFTGVPARHREGPALILEVAEEPIDLRPASALPTRVEGALARLLAFDPSGRAASAKEVLDQLT